MARHPRWSAQEIVVALHALAKELGRKPVCDDLRSPYPSQLSLQKRFGSVRLAFTAAGFAEVRRRPWTRIEAMIALRAEALRIGKIPGDTELRSRDRVCPALSTYHKLFGSLSAAQRAAGFTPRARGGYRRKPFYYRPVRRLSQSQIAAHNAHLARHWGLAS